MPEQEIVITLTSSELTLEDEYRAAVHAIPHSRGSVAYGAVKARLWDRFEADKYRRGDGAPTSVNRLQRRFAVEYYQLVESFYNGEVTDQDYRRRRVLTLRRYAQRLLDLGLVSGVFDDAWVRDFARDSLQLERQLVPVPHHTGWTEKESTLLCNPLRDFSKQFFRRVHAQFGVGRLKEHPKVYGGVDAGRCEEELGRAPV